jgi:WD40 repeat protein
VFFTAEKSVRTAPAPIQTLCFSSDGERILICGGDGAVRHLWAATAAQIVSRSHTLNPEWIRVVDYGGDMMPKSVGFLNTRAKFLSGETLIGYVVFKELRSPFAAEWGVLDAFEGTQIFGAKHEIPIFSDSGDRILTYKHMPGSAPFEASMLQVVGRSVSHKPLKSTTLTTTFFKLFFADGRPRLLCPAEGHHESALIDLETGKKIAILPINWMDYDKMPSDSAVLYSPSSNRLYSSVYGEPLTQEVDLNDLGSRQLLRSDAGLAAVAGENGIVLIELGSGSIVRKISVASLGKVKNWEVSPNLLLAVAIGGSGRTSIVNLGFNQDFFSLHEHGDETSSAALSPQLNRVAVGRMGSSGTIYGMLWS